MLGVRWKQVVFAIFLLLLPIWIIIISLKDYSVLNNNEALLDNLDNIFTVGGEILAACIALVIAGNIKGNKFGPGMGLLALGLIFVALTDGLWWVNSLIEDLYLVPKYGSNALMTPEALINWILMISEHYFSLFEGVFIVLAALALKDSFETAEQLQIEIDREKAKIEIYKVVDSDYFEKIRKEAINLRKSRDKT
jgi:hypothetical protein